MPLVPAQEKIEDTENMRHMQIERLQAAQRDAIDASTLCELQQKGACITVVCVHRLNEQ